MATVSSVVRTIMSIGIHRRTNLRHQTVTYLVLAIVTALGCAEAFGIAEMISNYAKVSVNGDGGYAENDTGRSETSTFIREVEPTTAAVPVDEDSKDLQEYDDFDDLEQTSEESARAKGMDANTMLKYVSGVVNLLALMQNFGGGTDAVRNRRKQAGIGEPRYQPDTVSKRFKSQSSVDQEYQPIENFPPYNPLVANTADSYSQNGMKTSYDADDMHYKHGMMAASYYPAQDDQSNGDDGKWNAVGHDDGHSHYYKPETDDQSWMKSNPIREPYDTWKQEQPQEPRQPWTDYPVYRPPEHKPFPEYHDHFIIEQPEEDHHAVEEEDRESKRPYSYYFLGRKLWYIPLLFSLYFILYVGALVLKSVARHKIQFPDKLWELKDEQAGYVKHRRQRRLDELTEKYENAVQSITNKFM